MIIAAMVLLPYGLVYFAIAAALKVPEVNAVFGRALKMVGIQKR